jgi:hypothetical protein
MKIKRIIMSESQLEKLEVMGKDWQLVASTTKEHIFLAHLKRDGEQDIIVVRNMNHFMGRRTGYAGFNKQLCCFELAVLLGGKPVSTTTFFDPSELKSTLSVDRALSNFLDARVHEGRPDSIASYKPNYFNFQNRKTTRVYFEEEGKYKYLEETVAKDSTKAPTSIEGYFFKSIASEFWHEELLAINAWEYAPAKKAAENLPRPAIDKKSAAR